MDRISFNNKESLEEFFTAVREDSQLTWKQIADSLMTTRAMLDNYRSGKLLMPEDRFTKLLNLSYKTGRGHFLKLIQKRDSNWGRRLGGQKAYILNKEAFNIGRKKGGIGTIKYNFDINMLLSKELCEFIGVIIGDGFTNKYKNLYLTQVTGDKILDKEYYYTLLSNMCKRLFNIPPKIKLRENGIYFSLHSKRLFEMLTIRFKIPAGVKCYTIEIPAEILKSNKDMINSTLRGMFNTDGGVGIDKRKIYKIPYIRVNYTSASPNLINQISFILDNYEIPHSVHSVNNGHAQQIQINGEKNVKVFLQEIGFSNSRHLKKVEYLLNK